MEKDEEPVRGRALLEYGFTGFVALTAGLCQNLIEGSAVHSLEEREVADESSIK